jgi:hypothetical protein
VVRAADDGGRSDCEANAGIPTDGDPPPPANLPYPFLIGSFRPEVIVVPFKSHTGSAEKRRKLSAPISIGEKYLLTRLVHMRPLIYGMVAGSIG